jgi:hypothetical protein
LYPEKRPFFLENAAVFQTPQPLFFSRRIAAPNAGARITGRSDKWSYGAMLIDDESLGKGLPTDDRRYGKNSRVTVARLQNDFAKGSNLGVLFTDRQFDGIGNSVLGFDLHQRIDQNWDLNVQLARSRSEHTEAPAQNGMLKYLGLQRKGRSFSYAGTLLDISSNFDTSLAFLPRTDVRQLRQEGKYLWNFSDHAWIQSVGPQLIAQITKDHQDKTQDNLLDAAFLLTTTNNTEWGVHAKKAYEVFNGTGFNKQGVAMDVFSGAFDWVDLTATAEINESVNYSPTARAASTPHALLGNARSMSANLIFKPHYQWRVEQRFFWNDLRSKNAIEGAIYRNVLARTKISYQHNLQLGARLILDYNLLSANEQLTTLKSGKQLNTDFQVSYVLNPGTTLFAGFADRQQNLALVGNPASLQYTADLDMHTGRSAFVKMSYLFRP